MRAAWHFCSCGRLPKQEFLTNCLLLLPCWPKKMHAEQQFLITFVLKIGIVAKLFAPEC